MRSKRRQRRAFLYEMTVQLRASAAPGILESFRRDGRHDKAYAMLTDNGVLLRADAADVSYGVLTGALRTRIRHMPFWFSGWDGDHVSAVKSFLTAYLDYLDGYRTAGSDVDAMLERLICRAGDVTPGLLDGMARFIDR